MDFKNIKDNEKLAERLENVVEQGKVFHAYIFEGDNCIDKKNFAESFVKGILCPRNDGSNCGICSICDKIDHGNHEDVIYVEPEGSSIKDAAVVKMQERLKTKAFGDRNVVIIENSDLMTLRAQNRLLKTLEEPPGSAVIILLTENIENLTKTIQSRCVKYRINHFGSEGYDFMLKDAEKMVKLMMERAPFYVLKEKTDKLIKDKDHGAFLDSLQVVYRNMLINKDDNISLLKDNEIIDRIHAVEAARKQIKQGVAVTYAIRNLILKIGG